jgi:hypothetical protein
VSDQQHAPTALYPRKSPGTPYTRGWVGPRAGLDRCGKSRPTGIRSTDRPARSSVAIPTELPEPTQKWWRDQTQPRQNKPRRTIPFWWRLWWHHIYYYYYYYYFCLILLLHGTHYITTFFVCNFVAVFAVPVQITLLTQFVHLFMNYFSSSFTCLCPLVLYIHQTENWNGYIYYVSHLTVSHLTEMSPQCIFFKILFHTSFLESKSWHVAPDLQS